MAFQASFRACPCFGLSQAQKMPDRGPVECLATFDSRHIEYLSVRESRPLLLDRFTDIRAIPID
jgi:hypothetical protein